MYHVQSTDNYNVYSHFGFYVLHDYIVVLYDKHVIMNFSHE